MINKITLAILFSSFCFIALAQEVAHKAKSPSMNNSSNVVKLKVQRIEGEGENETLSNIVFHYEIEDNEKLYFIKNGKRQKGQFDLELFNYEQKPNGMLVINYKILNEEVDFDRLTIIDISKLSVAQRKKTFDVAYSMLLLMEDSNNKDSSVPMAAELLSGQFENSTKAPAITLSTINSRNEVVKLKSLSDDSLYEVEIENKSKFTIKEDGDLLASFDIKSMGEEYKNGAQVFNFMILEKDLGYRMVSVFDMSELSRGERADAMGVICPVIITIGGGDRDSKIIPAEFVSGRFPKVKNATMIHKELTSLFESMENGFSDQKREEKKLDAEEEAKKILKGHDTEFYKSDMELGYLKSNVINVIKGVDYYEATISYVMTSQIEQVLHALESYPSSGAFKISQLSGDDSDRNYVVKKSKEAKGFIRFFKNQITENEKWSFQVFKAIDRNKMKASLLAGADLIENNWETTKRNEDQRGLF